MLARRLLIGFLGVIMPSTLLLWGVTVYAISSLDRLNHRLVQITHSREAVADLRVTLTEIGHPLAAYAVDRDPTHRQWFEGLLRQAEERLTSCASEACHVSSKTPGRMAEALRPALLRLRADGNRIFAAETPIAVGLSESIQRVIAGLREAAAPMLAAERLSTEKLESAVEAVERRAWLLSGSFALGICVAGSVAAIVMARRIGRPLSELVQGTRRVRTGDWAYQARVSDGGEIGELASSFNAMVEVLGKQREQLEEQKRTLEARVRRRTEELRRKEEALALSEKLASLGQLAAGVAHELNNPLTSIMMNVDLLSEEIGEGSPLRGDLQRVSADVGRCRRIIEDLRTFARLPRVDRAAGEVGAVVEQAVGIAAHELSRRGVRVVRDLPSDLPRVVWDADRIVQVLSNLLVNAAHAVEAGGGVTVRGRHENGWLSLEVADDGPGIPPAHRSRVFDPFFTTKPDGTGLGLSISHGIVTEHGGRIEVESLTREEARDGARPGTTVRVMLPVVEALA